MRKFPSSILGFLATLLGTMIIVPRINEKLWTSQLALNEYPWIATTLGLGVALRRKGSAVGRAFGLYGALLSLRPLLQIRRAIDDMELMMCEGLGDQYESAIPEEMRSHIGSTRWSWKTTLGISDAVSGVSKICDVEFAEREMRQLKLDIYLPSISPIISAFYPAIIVLHPGGWRNGDKGGYFEIHNRHLAKQGYVVFDAQYRLTTVDSARWPSQLEDVRDAIRWVRLNAEKYQIDSRRIALMGRSAGGQLALQAAYRSTETDADTSVNAVVAIYAPINMRLTGAQHDIRVLEYLGGASYQIPDVYADASPLDFAKDGVPPTMLIHGGMDSLVPHLHAELLLNKLRTMSSRCVLLRVPWGRHGFDGLMGGLGAQLTQYYIDRFLAWNMYQASVQ
jgi:acetyl esterase/lipase